MLATLFVAAPVVPAANRRSNQSQKFEYLLQLTNGLCVQIHTHT